MYRVVTTRQFDNDFRQLDNDTASRVISKAEWLSNHPESLRFPLKHVPSDLKGLHKYRIGDYRLLLWVDHDKQVLTLYAVKHRSSIYKNL
ncbi:MAG: type II toxin-antitoxin system RelE/ParE family toxin [Dehalococcoidia bacterium]|nr:type II toxin-antitoxin system RelE/ParE family toxin [Dehalococcoidia bacterium]